MALVGMGRSLQEAGEAGETCLSSRRGSSCLRGLPSATLDKGVTAAVCSPALAFPPCNTSSLLLRSGEHPRSEKEA